ncbi:MAG: hypothetical protein RR877_01290 [Aurantimicrobium sp.]|uniref:hypothetical protein n=1 Tax=Aurantimicrobium sp. TaxID=1930784 RepID=UPI002FC842D6
MIIQDPMEFFKIPEHVVTINIVDVVNRFTTMIEEYLIEMEPAYITNSGAKVIVKKSDKILDSKGEVVAFENFLKLDGDYLLNGNPIVLNSLSSRKNYRPRTKIAIATEILIAFVKDDISKRSNWEAVFDVYEAIEPYIDRKYDVNDVCGYIVERIDPFIRSIIDHYHGKDWNVHEVEYDGFRLTLKRYGDWRAYMWNQQQYDKQQQDTEQS